MALADSAGILCKIDIQQPVQPVLDRPVTADGAGQPLDSQWQAADGEVNLLLFAALTPAVRRPEWCGGG